MVVEANIAAEGVEGSVCCWGARLEKVGSLGGKCGRRWWLSLLLLFAVAFSVSCCMWLWLWLWLFVNECRGVGTSTFSIGSLGGLDTSTPNKGQRKQ